MTVYPDLAFFLGAVLHGATLRLALRLLDLRRPRWLFFAVTVCSGISCALSVLPNVSLWIPILIALPSSLSLLYGKTVAGTARNLLAGFGVTVFYLGTFFLLSEAFFFVSVAFFDGEGYFILSFFRTLISLIFSFLLGEVLIRIRSRRKNTVCCDCLLSLLGKQIPFRACVDTGNFLTDPVSGLSVVILEFSLLQKAFGKDFPRPVSYEFSTRFSTRFRVIPYRSVSGDGQMLCGFVPDSFEVDGVSRSVVVAVSEATLEGSGRFFGIIGSNLIGGE